MIERGVFPFVALATVDRQLATPIPDRVEQRSERTACFDLRKLMVIADHDHFGPRTSGVGDHMMEVERADHAGFVHHHHSAVVEVVHVEALDRHGVDTGTVAQLACCTPRRARTQHPIPGRFVQLTNRVHRVRLAGACFADDRFNAEALAGEAAQRVGLIGTQRGVRCQIGRHQRRVEHGGGANADSVAGGEQCGEFGLFVQ